MKYNTKQCTYCGENISIEEKVCPYCGENVTNIPRIAKLDYQNREGNNKSFLMVIVIGSVIIFGLLFLILNKSSSNIDPQAYIDTSIDDSKDELYLKESHRVDLINRMAKANPNEAGKYYVIFYNLTTSGWSTYNYDGEYTHTYDKYSDCYSELVRGQTNSNKYTTVDWQCVSL